MHSVIRIAVLSLAAALLVTAAPAAPAAEQPIVTVTRRGGFCLARSACMKVLRIGDTTISGEGYVPRRLGKADRAALLRAIAALDVASLRPFRGTCPTSHDVPESVYRFRGIARALAECKYDLERVRAVQ